MSKDKKPIKVKAEKKYTRAQAEKMLAAGVDPTKFETHPNVHVLKKSWVKMGRPAEHHYLVVEAMRQARIKSATAGA